METRQLGKYRLLEEIGQGGMGAVYHARDEVIGRDVAVKLIAERVLHVPEIRSRFYREASSAGRLNHENIVVVHDLGEHDGMPFIVMELLRGSDLRKIIRSDPSLALEQKLSIAIQICDGLAFAHSHGVIHRDVKPENIQILDGGRVKILDFGVARIASEVQATTRSNVGTPRYMSPEQITGAKIDHRTDIFSFGVVLYEMLTGIAPFSGEHVTEIIYKILHQVPEPIRLDNAFVSQDLQRIVSRCLGKSPDQRYPDFRAAAADLGVVLARQEQAAFVSTGLPPLASPDAPSGEEETAESEKPGAGAPVPGSRPVAASRLRPVLPVSALAVLVALSGWFYLERRQSGPEAPPLGVSDAAPSTGSDTSGVLLMQGAAASPPALDASVLGSQTPERQPLVSEAEPGVEEPERAPARLDPNTGEAERRRRMADQARQAVASISKQVPPLRAEREILAEADRILNRARQELSKGYAGMAAHSFSEAERRYRQALRALDAQLASLKRDAEGARTRALEAQRQAKAFAVDSLRAPSLNTADSMMGRAEAEFAQARYQQAVGSFRRAQALYDAIRPAPAAVSPAP